MKSTFTATFICSIFTLIGRGIHRQSESANGGDLGAGASVLGQKRGGRFHEAGRFYSQVGHGHRFG
jgi:hypothetical protein